MARKNRPLNPTSGMKLFIKYYQQLKGQFSGVPDGYVEAYALAKAYYQGVRTGGYNSLYNAFKMWLAHSGYEIPAALMGIARSALIHGYKLAIEKGMDLDGVARSLVDRGFPDSVVKPVLTFLFGTGASFSANKEPEVKAA